MQITLVENGAPEAERILLGLREHNNDAGVNKYPHKTYTYLAHDDDGNYCGGAKIMAWAGWMSIELVSVKEQGKGLGSKLMSVIEEKTKNLNLKGMYLVTSGFQAPEFYKKHDFEIAGEIPRFLDNHSQYLMFKRL